MAGGVASRMKKDAQDIQHIEKELIDQANTLTKGMIGLGKEGKSLIDYQLYNASVAGFEEVLLLLHPNDSFTQPYYENLVQTGKHWGLTFFFARQTISQDRIKPAGTADAVWQALQQHPQWQKGRTIVCNSDNLYSVKALEVLWNCPHTNALVSYDRDSLDFPLERIKAFAIIEPDEQGFLHKIIEKPSEQQAEEVLQKYGRIGVSMNAFVLEAEDILPALAQTPFHPERNEKELPTSLSMMNEVFHKKIYCIPLAENVPDLTSKHDIETVKAYLEETYSF